LAKGEDPTMHSSRYCIHQIWELVANLELAGSPKLDNLLALIVESPELSLKPGIKKIMLPESGLKPSLMDLQTVA